MMIKKSILLFICLSLSCMVFSQKAVKERKTQDVLFFELGGNNYLYSANYEKVFLTSKTRSLFGRIGFCYFKNDLLITSSMSVTTGILIGDSTGKYRGEFAIGSFFASYPFKTYITPIANIGIRKYFRLNQNKNYIKIAFTPFFKIKKDDLTDIYQGFSFLPWAGISYGIIF